MNCQHLGQCRDPLQGGHRTAGAGSDYNSGVGGRAHRGGSAGDSSGNGSGLSGSGVRMGARLLGRPSVGARRLVLSTGPLQP